MRETQETIGAWADATFGVPSSACIRPLRLLEEVVELCLAAGATPMQVLASVDRGRARAGPEWGMGMEPRPKPEEVPEELADCMIVLATCAHAAGVDLDAEVDRKMAVNRARARDTAGDGVGQHRQD